MNIYRQPLNPERAEKVAHVLCHLRTDTKISKRALAETIGMRSSFVASLESTLEPLLLTDFIAIVLNLGGEPIAIVRELSGA